MNIGNIKGKTYFTNGMIMMPETSNIYSKM